MGEGKIIENLNKMNPVKKVKSKKKRIVIYAILLVLLALVITSILKPKQEEFKFEEHTVAKGNINVIVEGNGVVEPNNQYNITSLVQGEILEDYFKEGEFVEKDKLLYVIESEDLQTSIERAELALDRAQNAYSTTLETSELTATSNGTLINSSLKLGDMIVQGQQIAEVLDSNQLRLVLQYNYLDAKDMHVGQTANVTVENGYYSLTGVVTKISSDHIINQSGMGISYVEINVTNPGNIQNTDYGIASINGIASNNSNTFEYVNKSVVYATGSGYIKQINKLPGDHVTKGTVVATIGSSVLDAQIKQAQLNLTDAQLSLENAKHQLKNYNLTAPISGKILVKNNKKGDVLSTSSAMTTPTPLAIIADMDRIVFTMNVDELEIAKVQIGQSVKVTADAIEGKEFVGTVDNINIVGTSMNGVATYSVKIVINDPEGLFPGMNVDSEIQIVSVTDVVCVPLSAVQRGNVVYIKDSNSNYQDADTSVPKGYRKVEVRIGKNDKDNIEILSGLNVGDIVLVQKAESGNIMNFMASMAQNGGSMFNEM